MNQTLSIAIIERLIETSPSRLVVILYDELLKSLETTIEAIEAGDIEARCHAANCAIEILCHLYLTLDTEQGGEIAQRLSDIYRFVLSRLPRVNAANDAEPAREAIRLLAPVRASWRELDERIEASATTAGSLIPPPVGAGATANA